MPSTQEREVEGDRIGSRVTWSNGRKHGDAVILHPNGRVAKQGPYVRDLKDGTWQEWNSDGSSRALLNYAEGILHGHCRWMASNGQVLADERYIHGKLEGHVRRYFADGTLRQELTYHNGAAEGDYWRRMEAHEDTSAGSIIAGHYLQGKPHGTWQGLSGDGLRISEGQFMHGQRIGIWRYWDRSGNLVREDEFNADGGLVESRSMVD